MANWGNRTKTQERIKKRADVVYEDGAVRRGLYTGRAICVGLDTRRADADGKRPGLPLGVLLNEKTLTLDGCIDGEIVAAKALNGTKIARLGGKLKAAVENAA